MKHVFIMLLLVFSAKCFGQGTQIYEYDWKTKIFTKDTPGPVKEGTTIGLRIKNINPFAFTFDKTTFTPVNLNYEDGLDKLTAGLGSLTGASGTANNEPATVEKKGDIKANITHASRKALDNGNSFWKQHTDILSTIHDSLLSASKNIISIREIMNFETILQLASKDPNIFDTSTMKSLIFSSDPNITPPRDFISHTNSDIASLITALDEALSAINKLEGLPAQTGYKFTDAQQKTETALITGLRKQITDTQALYTSETLQKLRANAATYANESSDLVSSDFTYSTETYETNADFVKMQEDLKSKDESISRSIARTVKVYGGSRINFSVGLAVNVGGNGADYSLRKNPADATGADSSSISLYKSSKNKLMQFSPVILIHWYKVSKSSSVQWMLSGGVAPDFSTLANSRIFLGTSLGFPSSNDLSRRLVLSAGLSVGYADVLKSSYRDWQDYKRFTDVKDEDLTQKAVRAGAFFSITYNLSGSKAK